MCLKRLLWKSTEKTDLESLIWALAPAGLWPAAQSIEKFSMLCADQIFGLRKRLVLYFKIDREEGKKCQDIE